MDAFVFSELLRGFRNREGYTQLELAKKINVRRSTIINWEKSKYLPRNIDSAYKIADVLNLSPKETEKLLNSADPDKRRTKDIINRNDRVINEINISSGQINILQEDISSTIQLICSLKNTFTSKNFGKAQIEKIAKVFKLFERRKINGHLRYNAGDISFWYKEDLNLDELLFQFAARKVVLDAAERSSVNINDQGTLSFAATRVIPLLHRPIDGVLRKV